MMLSHPYLSAAVSTILTNKSIVGCRIWPHFNLIASQSWSLSCAEPFNGVKLSICCPLESAWCWGLKWIPGISRASCPFRNIIIPSWYNLYSNLFIIPKRCDVLRFCFERFWDWRSYAVHCEFYQCLNVFCVNTRNAASVSAKNCPYMFFRYPVFG